MNKLKFFTRRQTVSATKMNGEFLDLICNLYADILGTRSRLLITFSVTRATALLHFPRLNRDSRKNFKLKLWNNSLRSFFSALFTPLPLFFSLPLSRHSLCGYLYVFARKYLPPSDSFPTTSNYHKMCHAVLRVYDMYYNDLRIRLLWYTAVYRRARWVVAGQVSWVQCTRRLSPITPCFHSDS